MADSVHLLNVDISILISGLSVITNTSINHYVMVFQYFKMFGTSFNTNYVLYSVTIETRSTVGEIIESCDSQKKNCGKCLAQSIILISGLAEPVYFIAR